MSIGIWNLQWLNQNSQRAYPISDASSRRCKDDSSIVLPDDVILALSFAIHSGHNVNPANFYIRSIVLGGTGCSIYIGYADADAAVTHITYNASDPIVTAVLTGINDFDDTVGYIAVNSQSIFLKANAGKLDFNLEGARIELDCIRPMLRSITSITLDSAGSTSPRIYGDVVLKAGANIMLSATTANNVTTITISALSQDYEETCSCTDDDDRPPIKSINGVTPSSSGNISIVGSDCCSISGSDSTLTLSDTCAQPCCGCAELDAIRNEVEKFADGKATLETFVSNITSSLAAIQTLIAGSV